MEAELLDGESLFEEERVIHWTQVHDTTTTSQLIFVEDSPEYVVSSLSPPAGPEQSVSHLRPSGCADAKPWIPS